MSLDQALVERTAKTLHRSRTICAEIATTSGAADVIRTAQNFCDSYDTATRSGRLNPQLSYSFDQIRNFLHPRVAHRTHGFFRLFRMFFASTAGVCAAGTLYNLLSPERQMNAEQAALWGAGLAASGVLYCAARILNDTRNHKTQDRFRDDARSVSEASETVWEYAITRLNGRYK